MHQVCGAKGVCRLWRGISRVVWFPRATGPRLHHTAYAHPAESRLRGCVKSKKGNPFLISFVKLLRRLAWPLRKDDTHKSRHDESGEGGVEQRWKSALLQGGSFSNTWRSAVFSPGDACWRHCMWIITSLISRLPSGRSNQQHARAVCATS